MAVYRATGLVRSYTLECNYNTGRFCNVLPPLPGDPEPPADRPLVFEPVAYTTEHYQQVGGQGCLCGMFVLYAGVSRMVWRSCKIQTL